MRKFTRTEVSETHGKITWLLIYRDVGNLDESGLLVGRIYSSTDELHACQSGHLHMLTA